jgi:hypothetical protein
MKYDVKKTSLNSNQLKIYVFSLPFRWFPILAYILGILFFVILTHLLVEKCNNYWSNEISDSVEDVENIEADEQHTIADFWTALNYIVIISIIYSIRFSVQYYFLSPRMSLLLRDSEIILELMITIPNYYFKNPLLRHFILKNVLKRSIVHPENNQIELQSI